jgi:dienelactone hydrolase
MSGLSARNKKKKSPLPIKAALAILAIVFLPVALGVWVVLAPMIPLNLPALAAQNPPRSVSHRKPIHGCGLNQLPDHNGACQPLRALSFTEEDLRFPAANPHKGLSHLRGTLTLPQNAPGPRPAILLIAGSGPTPRDADTWGDLIYKIRTPLPIMKALAHHLAAQGFVVLRYDKRSCVPCYKDDNYAFDPATFRFHDFIDDARAALDLLASRPEVDPQRLVLLGHSQGAHLAPLIADQDPRVAALSLWAGHLDNFEVVLIQQFNAIADLRLARGDLLSALLFWQQRNAYQQCFDKLRDPDHDPDEVCIGGGVTQAALKAYLDDSAQLPAALARTSAPTQFLLGNLDRNIQPAAFDQMASALKDHDAELHLLHGACHPMIDALADPNPSQLAPAALEALDRFLSTVGTVK